MEKTERDVRNTKQKQTEFILTSLCPGSLTPPSFAKKVFSSLHSLRRFRKIFPSGVKAKLIQSLVLPLVDYCDVVYCGLSDGNSVRLQKVFNNCVRYIFNSKPADHITPLLKDLS
jgi:hypothetical protein